MYSEPTEYTCPQCYSAEMFEDPTRDVVGCANCKLLFTGEDLIEYERTGVPPEPFGKVDDV